MIKIQQIDSFILLLMFVLLPIDMLNGFLLKNQIFLPISIAQIFKIIIIFLLLFRFLFKPEKLFFVLLLVFFLLFPTLYQILVLKKIDFLFFDIIKIMRYLMPFFSFLFFVEIIKNNNTKNIKRMFKVIRFSYIVLVFNIFIKYLGFGYPMYKYGDIGSKGFFYAGNEISALLIILSGILAFGLWYKEEKLKYYLFLVFNIIVGIAISSKTGVLGILLVFFLIPINFSMIKVNIKKLKYFVLTSFILFPLVIIYSWQFILQSAVFIRLKYFWKKFDFWTFILSNRNVFLSRARKNYIEHYSFIEKIIGVGQVKYENINNGKIVEIDIIDVFFAYGYIGLFLFFLLISFLTFQANRFMKNDDYIYSSFVFLMIFVLLGISSMAGHVFSSGMSAVFIGLLFSLMYLKKDDSII